MDVSPVRGGQPVPRASAAERSRRGHSATPTNRRPATSFAASPEPAGAAEGSPVPRGATSATGHSALAVYLGLAFVLLMGQNVLAPNLTAAAQSLGLSEQQRDEVLGGWMSSAFFLVGAPCSLFVGSLADTLPRRRLFTLLAGGTVLVTGLSGLVSVAPLMLLLRVALGALLGGVQPILFSVAGDLFPPAKRGAIASLIAIAVGGGQLVGQLVAGYLGAVFGWRSPFLVYAFLAVAGTLVFVGTAQEPRRGAADTDGTLASTASSSSTTSTTNTTVASGGVVAADDGEHAKPSRSGDTTPSPEDAVEGSAPLISSSDSKETVDEAAALLADTSDEASTTLTTPSSSSSSSSKAGSELSQFAPNWDIIRRVLLIPTNQLIFAQALPGTLPWGVITVFFVDFLVQEKGFPAVSANHVTLAFALGGLVGGIGAGVLGQRIFARGARWLPLAIGLSNMLAVLPILVLLNVTPDKHAALRAHDAALVAASASGTVLAVAPPAFGPTLWTFVLATAAGLFSSFGGPNLKFLLMNVNLPQHRGSVITVQYLADSVGKGVGPTLVGLLLRVVPDRTWCLSLATTAWLLSGTIVALIARFIDRDQSESRARLRLASKPAGKA